MKFTSHKIVWALALFASLPLAAQTQEIVPQPKTEKKIEMGLEGMLGISFNDKTIALNVGGPSLKYKLKNNFKVGIGAFPSMVVLHRKVYPRLAFSPIIEYKKWLLIAPYYGYDTDDKMIWTFGLGYRFL